MMRGRKRGSKEKVKVTNTQKIISIFFLNALRVVVRKKRDYVGKIPLHIFLCFSNSWAYKAAKKRYKKCENSLGGGWEGDTFRGQRRIRGLADDGKRSKVLSGAAETFGEFTNFGRGA